MSKGLDKWTARMAGPRRDASDDATDAANRASTAANEKKDSGGVTRGTLRMHAAAGEAHLKAAEMHKATLNPNLRGAAIKQRISDHLKAASEHASKAGDQWDEAKHPRGADGKFT